MPGFRINRKKVGLTYSCPQNLDENPIESNEKLLEFLESKGELSKYIVSTELHENGKKHFHVYACYENKLNSTDSRFFDYQGVHPNILSGSPGNGWPHYCAKDKNYITNFYERDPYTEALQKATWEEALDHLREKRPADVLKYGTTLEANYKKYRKAEAKGERPERTFNREFETDFKKSWVFVGPPGLGKTQYAKYHFKNPLFVCHLDQLKDLTPEHDGIVFDDMDFKHLPRSTQIYLTDMEEDRCIHVRYSTVTIPAGTKRIFTCNQYCFIDDEAINRRVSRLNISGALF